MLKISLDQVENIVCIAHKGPDGDAVGSTVALATFLNKMGKNAQVVLPNPAPPYLQFMPKTDKIINHDNHPEQAKKLLAEADLIFCLDFNTPARVGTLEKALVESKAYKVMIDHHLYPADFCNEIISKPEISSTCQMVFDFMATIDETLIYDQEIMTSIYTGILTDTGSFRFSSVDGRTHEIAQKFIDKGFDHERIHREIFDQNKIERMKLMGYCIHQKMEILEESSLGILTITQEELNEFSCEKSDTEGFVNMLLSLEGVEVAGFFIQQGEMTKLSFRAVGNWNVNEIMSEYFEGGGHKSAAGGQFKGDPEETVHFFYENVLPTLSKYHHE